LTRLRRAMQAQHAVFVGDDMTDEDVFTSANSQDVLGIRVGRTPRSSATHYLQTQADVDRLLECLLKLTAGPANS
jgi:trehalose-6-phosphatase